MKAKEIKTRLISEEDKIVKAATLYCSRHNMEFGGKHRVLLRVVLRKFFVDGVYPLIRDLNDVNIKDYHND